MFELCDYPGGVEGRPLWLRNKILAGGLVKRPKSKEPKMNDFRQVIGPLATVLLTGAVLIFGQIYLDHKSGAQTGRPAIAVALLQQ
jgi:hypothetical protein